MNWEAVSSLAEVVSAIAVVVSLIYVGVQIRQSNQLSRAETFHEIDTEYSHVMSKLVERELANIYSRAVAGKELDQDELVRYCSFLTAYFVWLEDVYIQQQSGLFDVELGTESVVHFMASQAQTLLKSKQSQDWWYHEAPKFLSPGFMGEATKAMKLANAT